MAFNFPDSPTLNDTSTQGGISYLWNGSSWTAQNSTVAFADLTGKPTTLAGYGITDGVSLSGLSATTNTAAGTGALTYNSQSGAFSYTPPDLSGYLEGTDISVVTATASGNGALAVDVNGGFTFTPADVSSKIQYDSLTVITAGSPSGSGALNYDNTTGVFTFTQPDLTSYVALGDLSIGTEGTASGDGAIAYNNSTGVFTYTPPDLSSYLTSVQASDLNAISVDALSDVDTSSVAPTDGQALIWDNANGVWEPGNVAGSSTDTLADITARGATTNDAVTINNTLTVTSLDSTGLGFASLSSGGDISLSASGDINVNSSNIINVTDPSNAQDAATKNYVDTTVAAYSMPTYTVANLPAGSAGNLAFATDGRKNGEGVGAGTGVMVFHDGTNWIASDSGQTVAA